MSKFETHLADYEHMFRTNPENDTVSKQQLIHSLATISSNMQGEYWDGIRYAISIIEGTRS